MASRISADLLMEMDAFEEREGMIEQGDNARVLFERLGADGKPVLDDITLVAHQMPVDTPVHRHDYYEVIYVASGTVINAVHDKELLMRDGDVCIMGVESVHSLRVVDRDALVVNICLRPEIFETDHYREFMESDTPAGSLLRGEGVTSYLFYPDTTSGIIGTLVAAIMNDYVGADRRQTLTMTVRTLLFLCELSRLDVYTYYGIDVQTLEILQRIEFDPATATVAGLAAEYGYSPNYFSQYMRRHTGRTAMEAITKARLGLASRLLRETDASVESVAREVGYSNMGHFHSLFKREFGMTPRAWRSQPKA